MNIDDKITYIDTSLASELHLSSRETNILKAYLIGTHSAGIYKFIYIIFESLKSLFFCSHQQQARSFLHHHFTTKITKASPQDISAEKRAKLDITHNTLPDFQMRFLLSHITTRLRAIITVSLKVTWMG